MNKIDKVINIIRQIKEEMGGMATGSSGSSIGFSSSADPKGPVAGYDPLIKFKNKNKDNIDFRRVPSNYKNWVRSIKN
jgi:hypothetical protein